MIKTASSGCWNTGLARPQVPLNTLQPSKYIGGKVFRLITWSPGINSMILVSVDSLTLASVLLGSPWQLAYLSQSLDKQLSGKLLWKDVLQWRWNRRLNKMQALQTWTRSTTVQKHWGPTQCSIIKVFQEVFHYEVLSHVSHWNKFSKVCKKWTQTWWQNLPLWKAYFGSISSKPSSWL